MTPAARRPLSTRGLRDYDAVFRVAAARVLLLSVLLVAVSLGLAAVLGDRLAVVGAAWGAGTGAAAGLVTAALLWVRWGDRPLLAGAGAAGSFLLKVVLTLGVILVLSGHRGSFDPVWFFVPLAVGVLAVVAVESWTLSHASLTTVVPLTPGPGPGPDDAAPEPGPDPGQVPRTAAERGPGAAEPAGPD